MANKIDYLRGKSGDWTEVIQPNKFGKWKISINLDNESLTKVLAWKKDGIKNHLNKDDDGYWITISRPTKIETRTGPIAMSPPAVINADNTVFNGRQIGKGSDVEVKVEVRNFTIPITGSKGVALRLAGVKIHDLVDFTTDEIKDEKQKELAKFPDYVPWHTE